MARDLAQRRPTGYDIEIRPHPCSTEGSPVWLVIVTKRHNARQYFLTWSGDQPTSKQIADVWTYERNAFSPYNS